MILVSTKDEMILVSTEDDWADIELAKIVIEMFRDYTHEYRDSLLRRQNSD